MTLFYNCYSSSFVASSCEFGICFYSKRLLRQQPLSWGDGRGTWLRDLKTVFIVVEVSLATQLMQATFGGVD